MKSRCLFPQIVLTMAACWVVVQAASVFAAEDEPFHPTPAALAALDEQAGPPLWLGDPGVDIEKARAAYRAKYDDAQRQEANANLAAYDRVGTRNPSWDDDARQLIRVASLPTLTTPAESRAARESQESACLRALDHGCTDPFVTEIALWLGFHARGAKGDQLAQAYTEVESALAKSDYPARCKYVSAANTVEKDVDRRVTQGNTIGKQGCGNTQPARSWPKGTDVQTAFQHACAQLQALVKDPAIPAQAYMKVTEKLFQDASSDPVGRAEVLVPLAKFFETDEAKDHPTHGFKLVEGRFWIDYAWDARGGDYAGKVGEGQWKLFSERLDKARAALTAAWKLDPADVYAPRYMIVVAMGQGSGRDEMETWFRRAMDVRPDDYPAGVAKMLFLEPKWGGSWDAVLEFGRQCYATRNWSTRMPMLLFSAHFRRSKEETDPKTYWKAPDVWGDVQKVYAGYLAYNPTEIFDRTAYAVQAAFAEQWKVAHEQFELVGDKPSEELLHIKEVSLKEYRKLRKQAAERAGDTNANP